MKQIAFIYPFYDNAGMLAEHYREWSSWSEALRREVEFVIVDDGTPTVSAAEVPRPDNISYRLFRVGVDLPWCQHGCRNIGAHEAKAKWLFLSDMDLLVPETTAAAMIKETCKPDLHTQTVFTFDRWDADTMKMKLRNGKPHPHPNTFLMRKEFYWAVGGYDEDYLQIYGTDGLFRKRLWSVARHIHLADPILRYSREFLEDASTRTLPRKEGREPGAKEKIDAQKREAGTYGKPKTLSMPYALVERRDPFRAPPPQEPFKW